MSKVAVVTGAGSGVGQAIAWELLDKGWQVVLVGRRKASLEDTAAHPTGAGAVVFPCDISDPVEVARLASFTLEKYGRLEVLVNAAGINTPQRDLKSLSWDNYRQIVEVNLHGAYLCIQAFLPSMRQARSGTIINIVSDAGIRANAKAGAAYVVSKFGLAGLTQAVNSEERENGIRACAIFPGDINTPLLDLRPNPPPAEARQGMLQPEDVARCALLAIELPAHALIEEIVIKLSGALTPAPKSQEN